MLGPEATGCRLSECSSLDSPFGETIGQHVPRVAPPQAGQGSREHLRLEPGQVCEERLFRGN
eukprot:10608569-Karenia_brevis.AAC.1